MTMYLPDPAVRPTGSEPVEFLDLPPMANEGQGESVPAGPLSSQARMDITRRARDYVTKLVATHRGDSEDVRSIIHDLQDQVSVTDHPRAG